MVRTIVYELATSDNKDARQKGIGIDNKGDKTIETIRQSPADPKHRD